MDKLKKVGLTALGTALVSTASYAAELTVTGSAGLTLVGGDNTNTGNGWSQSDTLTFAGSADLDNGMSVSTSLAIDGGIMDANSLTLNMNDMGTLKFAGTDGSGPVGAWDDITPTANEEAWADVTGATAAPGGTGGLNMFHYSTSSLMDGVKLSASYTPSDGTSEIQSSQDYGLMYTGVDGLSIYAAAGEDNGAAAKITNSIFGIKYAMGAMTVGYQTNEVDSNAANGDRDFTAAGISYAMSDDLSVSVNSSTIDYEASSKDDQEATSVSFSHTSGGMTISGSYGNMDNVAGTPTADNSAYEINFKFAF